MSSSLVGFSTGIFARRLPEEALEEAVLKILASGASCVEILLARPRLADIRFSPSTLQALSTVSVSVHAPFFQDEGFVDVRLDEALLLRVFSFAEHVGAAHVLVHPDLVDDWSIVDRSPVPIQVENVKSERGWPIQRMQQLLSVHKTFSLAFDPNHAGNEANSWFNIFQNRISVIHLSPEDQYKGILEGTWAAPFYMGHSIPMILEKRPMDFDDLPKIINRIVALRKEI